MTIVKHAITYIRTEKINGVFTPNIFEDEQAQIKAIGVNTEGIMGLGQAKEAKGRYPRLFLKYEAACRYRELKEGGDCKWLINPQRKGFLLAATKKEVSLPSKIHYLERICKNIRETCEKHKITSIALPMLGCGLGGLEWEEVGPMMAFYLDPLRNTEVRIYLPKGNKYKEYFVKEDMLENSMEKVIQMVMLDLRQLVQFGHSDKMLGIIRHRRTIPMRELNFDLDTYLKTVQVMADHAIFDEQRRVDAIQLILDCQLLPLDTPYLREALREAHTILDGINTGMTGD